MKSERINRFPHKQSSSFQQPQQRFNGVLKTAITKLNALKNQNNLEKTCAYFLTPDFDCPPFQHWLAFKQVWTTKQFADIAGRNSKTLSDGEGNRIQEQNQRASEKFVELQLKAGQSIASQLKTFFNHQYYESFKLHKDFEPPASVRKPEESTENTTEATFVPEADTGSGAAQLIEQYQKTFELNFLKKALKLYPHQYELVANLFPLE